ncbi:MAG: hypothetical protein V1492_01000 [Candidatus Micrarchaeota archaeon]
MGESEELGIKKSDDELIRQGLCPVCKARIFHAEGCIKCIKCGWSMCEP